MIREFKSDDLNSIWKIYSKYFPHEFARWKLEDVIQSGKTLIEGNSYCIYGVLISLIDQGDPWVWNITVKENYRGFGIATRLMNEIEKHYQGYQRICLYVSPDNPAQKLYFDLGYRITDIVKDVYKDGYALKMVKNLKN